MSTRPPPKSAERSLEDLAESQASIAESTESIATSLKTLASVTDRLATLAEDVLQRWADHYLPKRAPRARMHSIDCRLPADHEGSCSS